MVNALVVIGFLDEVGTSLEGTGMEIQTAHFSKEHFILREKIIEEQVRPMSDSNSILKCIFVNFKSEKMGSYPNMFAL